MAKVSPSWLKCLAAVLSATILCQGWLSYRWSLEIAELRKERVRLLNELAARPWTAASAPSARPSPVPDHSSAPDPELLKLRGEVARQRQEAQEQAAFLATLKDSTQKINALGAQAQWESFLVRAKKRLGLSDEQEQLLRALSKDDPLPSADNHRAEWDKILAAAQMDALAQFDQETKADVERLNACDLALMAMKDVQFYVGLSREQQDRAFPALMHYAECKARDEAERELHPGQTSSPAMTPADWLQLQMEALRGILTDEQLSIYQRYKEALAQAQPKGD